MVTKRTAHGDKTSAGMHLSKFLRDIGNETSGTAETDQVTGEKRIVTKAEKLARTIWQLALGYEEQVKVTDTATGKNRLVTKKYKPDQSCINMIFDRIEGKVAVVVEDGKGKKPISSRVSDQMKRRLNSKLEK